MISIFFQQVAETGVLVKRIASQKQILGWEAITGKIKVTEQEEGNVTTVPPRNKIPEKFLIDEIDFCTKQHPNLDVIAYVHSSISKDVLRNVTRTTWANATALGLALKLAVVFVVGRPETEEEAMIVREESQRYHDIIQVRESIIQHTINLIQPTLLCHYSKRGSSSLKRLPAFLYCKLTYSDSV